MVSRHYDGAVLIAPESESNYLSAYRAAFPEERFLSFSYEEVCSLFEFKVAAGAKERLASLGFDPRDLDYLRKMVGGPYKNERLIEFEPLVSAFLAEGLFVHKEDPANIFCGKTIIIRGYHEGKSIAEALQDLPNISLNWDLGQPRFGEEKKRDLQGDFASCCAYLSSVLKEIGAGDAYLRYDGDMALPSDLAALPRLKGPFAPSDAKVLYLEIPAEEESEDRLPPEALAELHLAPKNVREERRVYNEGRFLSHPSLYARAFAIKG
ncbi:MAG: hypothetical protein E7182_05975 [Erysipelotrichaceae bacterium]|nr:hypothetical protein [Erysipelotrichaceae bacterium]